MKQGIGNFVSRSPNDGLCEPSIYFKMPKNPSFWAKLPVKSLYQGIQSGYFDLDLLHRVLPNLFNYRAQDLRLIYFPSA
jgi:hypothetical protein